jgi:hypothetical protein
MAAEAQAKLAIQLKELVEIFESCMGDEGKSLMTTYLENNKAVELIELCTAYGRSKPFIDHDLLALRIKSSHYAIGDVLQFEKKNVKKRLNVLLADTKSDKELIQKVQNLVDDVDDRIRRNYSDCIKSKLVASIPLQHFTENEKFKPLNNPDFDPLSKGLETTIRKGYVVLVNKEDKKTYFYKKEEYRRYLSFYSEFPPVAK